MVSTKSGEIQKLPLPNSLRRFNKDYGLKYYYRSKNMYKINDDEQNNSTQINPAEIFARPILTEDLTDL